MQEMSAAGFRVPSPADKGKLEGDLRRSAEFPRQPSIRVHIPSSTSREDEIFTAVGYIRHGMKALPETSTVL